MHEQSVQQFCTASMSGPGGVMCSFDVQGYLHLNATNTDGMLADVLPVVADDPIPLVYYERGTTTQSVHALSSFVSTHPCYPICFMCRPPGLERG